MDLPQAEWRGPAIDDRALLARLPSDYTEIREQVNGFIACHGGLHVRGVCNEPSWHSIAVVWTGELALHELYPDVESSDIPFAEDIFSNQFLLRAGEVCQLDAGQESPQRLGYGLEEFLRLASSDPHEFLCVGAIERVRAEGRELLPHQGVSVYPPFIIKADSYSFRPVPRLELIGFYADIVRQLRDLPDGTEVEFRIGRPPS